MPQLVRVFVGALSAWLVASTAAADMTVRLSNEQLADTSSAIVIGRATSSQSRWIDRTLVTAVTVEISETLVTTKNINLNNFGNRNFVGFTGVPGGSYYAVRVPASQITAAATAAGGKLVFHSVAVDTFVADASVPAVFAEVTLTTGSVSGTTAAIDLAHPLDKATQADPERRDHRSVHGAGIRNSERNS
jgi:hypothetical protein